MIATGAAAKGATNLLHAIIESEATNKPGRDRGDRVSRCHRDREHRADHDEIRDDGRTQRGLVRVDAAQHARRERGEHHRGSADGEREGQTVDAPRHEPRDVADVGQEEGREPADELLARQHQEHVADEREHEGGDEPAAHFTVARIEQRRRGDQRDERARLADVFEAGRCHASASTSRPPRAGPQARAPRGPPPSRGAPYPRPERRAPSRSRPASDAT